jgi:lipooligosaccharide transport system permease protein
MMRSFFDWRSRAVLGRNASLYFRTWHIGLLPPAFEPILALLAFGFGLGAFVTTVPWHGGQLSYISYIAPGLIAYTSFTTPFFHALYAAYVRMHYQKTWDGQLTSQIELEHVVCGEILWAGLLGTVFAAIVSVVIALFAAASLLHIEWHLLPLILPLAFVAGCAFASVALVFTALVPSMDHMNLPAFLVGIPLSVVSDTYFPIASDNPLLRAAVACNPLHHLSETIRTLLLEGRVGINLVGLLISTFALIAVCTPLVVRLMRRRVLGEA